MNQKEIMHLLSVIDEHDLSVTEVIRLIENRPERKQEKMLSEIEMTVNYKKSVDSLIEEGGYDWVNKDINSVNFPAPIDLFHQEEVVIAKLFLFDKTHSNQERIAMLNKEGYSAANIQQMLFFADTCKNFNLPSPIACLGSTWTNEEQYIHMPILYINGGKRRLTLYWFNIALGEEYYILGVK